MDILHAIYLALLQGITEFLPISSSAHLILLPRLFGWPDQGIAFDVSVHVGTLTAVITYFRHELRAMIADWVRSVVQRKQVGESRLAWAVLWGTVPVGLAGLMMGNMVEAMLRNTLVIAFATIGFGLLLWFADVRCRGQRTEHVIGWKDVVLVGVFQAISLIPGTSRSGATMTAGLLMGLSRQAAARFSFLLSIPVIVLAGGYEAYKLTKTPDHLEWTVLAIGAGVSAITAYLCIHFFLKLLERMGMFPFVVYRMLLGAVLLYFAFV